MERQKGIRPSIPALYANQKSNTCPRLSTRTKPFARRNIAVSLNSDNDLATIFRSAPPHHAINRQPNREPDGHRRPAFAGNAHQRSHAEHDAEHGNQRDEWSSKGA